MKISDLMATGQAHENPNEIAAFGTPDDVRAQFSKYLEAFDAAGKARMEADLREKAADTDVAGWMLRMRELGLYEKARQQLMAEKNLDEKDLGAMTEDERIIFESQVYERVRHELVLNMKHHHCCECEEDEIRLYRYAPFLIS